MRLGWKYYLQVICYLISAPFLAMYVIAVIFCDLVASLLGRRG